VARTDHAKCPIGHRVPSRHARIGHPPHAGPRRAGAGREFGFGVYINGKRTNTWRYQLAERDGGTEVTESFELTPSGLTRTYWRLLGWHRARANEQGMRQTLERIRAVVEAR
jgi:hypothetical protein